MKTTISTWAPPSSETFVHGYFGKMSQVWLHGDKTLLVLASVAFLCSTNFLWWYSACASGLFIYIHSNV
jgi:hypothetical protein